MRLERLQLRNFRGVAEAVVSFAPSGVTLVTGPNEAGKSTLVEAIDLLFDLQDSSGHHRVRDAQPKGRDVGPEVTLALAFDGVHLTYSKRWLVQPQTELHVATSDGGREDLTARAAHERAEALLESHVDVALWRAVRLSQGEALALPSFRESSSLVHALDRAAGGSGDADDTLLERAQAELRRYRSEKQRRPTGELYEAISIEKAAKDELARAEEAYKRAREASAEIERHESELGSLERSLVDLVAAAKEAGVARAERQAAEEAHRQASQVALTARAELERATERARARQELAERLDRLERDLADLEAEVDVARRELERAEREREDAEAVLAAATQRRQASELHLHSLERALRRFELAQRERELAERLGRLEAAEAEANYAEAELAELTIDEPRLEEIWRARARVDQARARHEAASPTVTVEARSPLVLHVDDQEQVLGTDERWEQVTPDGVVIDIADHARVSVRPGATATAEEVAAAERALRRALDSVGASSIEDAEALGRRRRDLLQRLETARTRAEEATRPAGDAEELRRQLGQARAARELLDQEARTGDVRVPTTPEALDEALRIAASEVEEARGAESVAEEAAQARSDAAQQAAQVLSEREGARRNQALEADRARSELSAERSATPDEALEEAVDAARRRHDEAAERAAQAWARLEETDPLAAEKADRATAAVEETRRAQAELQATLKTEREHLARQLREGNAEARAEAERKARLAEQGRARVERRAAAAAMLVDTLRRHRDQAHRRYRQPLADQLRLWARSVLDEPVDAVELDESLRLQSLTRRGVTLPVDSLSAGTREQLGLLLRLAAATLAAPGGGVPVILDDALGYSDAKRIQGLLTVLDLAARQVQVIVLSAHPERYVGLGATRVDLTRQRPRALGAGDAADAAEAPEVPGDPSLEHAGPPRSPTPEADGEPTDWILACLAAADRPLGKAELCTLAGIDERAWTSTIRTLLERDLVVQEGHKRAARYRLATGPS